MRGATKKIIADYLETEFQSTLPVRGATWIWAVQVPGIHISIHAPRAGSDPWVSGVWYAVNEFQSTLPVRGATFSRITHTLSMVISIHAPRAGSDNLTTGWRQTGTDFNPRSPCGERRPVSAHQHHLMQFQSTLPVRGATIKGAGGVCVHVYFNPRSPCGERRVIACAPLRCGAFQSTLPVRGATSAREGIVLDFIISIHAPRAGSDAGSALTTAQNGNFNPRSPCGERQQYIVLLQAQSAIYTQSAILSIVNAIKGRRLLIEFGAKACGISCVLQIRTHKTSGSSTGIVSFEP